MSPSTEKVIPVIDKIRSCRLLITEAMHGAIIADTLRVPWVPLKTNKTINDFKWNDWSKSMEIDLRFMIAPTLYSDSVVRGIIHKRFPRLGGPAAGGVIGYTHSKTINLLRRAKFLKVLADAKKSNGQLSDAKVFGDRLQRLETKLGDFCRNYPLVT